MNPRDYIDVAWALATKEQATPAELRTAVSRAYYATFNAVVALLRVWGVTLRKAGKVIGW
jgi:uncharacterized protein (UPF0332 family)